MRPPSEVGSFEGAGLLRKRSDLPKSWDDPGVELERRDGARETISRQPLRWRESLREDLNEATHTPLRSTWIGQNNPMR